MFLLFAHWFENKTKKGRKGERAGMGGGGWGVGEE